MFVCFKASGHLGICCLYHGFYFPLRISELVERETEEYHKADPDPFDDRHPGKMMYLCCM